jgi:hypothetical protein
MVNEKNAVGKDTLDTLHERVHMLNLWYGAENHECV